MQVIETPVFTEQAQKCFTDESYRSLQTVLIQNPELGALIPRGKGLRKLRWHSQMKGKRGGLRVIYYWQVSDEVVYMLFVYKKSKQGDLTQKQLKLLAKYAEEYLS